MQLKEFSHKAFTIFEEEIHRDDRLLWVNTNHRQTNEICSSLIQIENEVDNGIYQHLSSLIMVSATMAVEDSFDHIFSAAVNPLSRGRQNPHPLEHSPFSYQEQACLLMVEDMVYPSHQEYVYQVTDALISIAEAVSGRVMALFTSRKVLTEVSGMLRPLLQGRGISLLVQNEDGDFGALMDGLLNSEKALLMGLDTYWEGVDLKGDLLKCVVVVKLPFRSPSDPYASAAEKYCRNNRQFLQLLHAS